MRSHIFSSQMRAHRRQTTTFTPGLAGSAPIHDLMDTLQFTLPISIALLDHNGAIVVVNEAWKRFAESNAGSRSSFVNGNVGMNYLAQCREASIPYTDGTSDVEANIRAVLDGTQPIFTTKYPLDSPNGVRWHLLQVTPLPGNLPGALVSHVDITEHKLTEKQWFSSLANEQNEQVERAKRVCSNSAPASVPISPAMQGVERISIDRLHALEALTDTALARLSLDGLMCELLERVMAVMKVDNAAILLLEKDGKTLTLRAVRGPEEQVAGSVEVSVGQGFAGRIAASKKPLLVDDLCTFKVVTPLLHEKLRSLVGVPLLVEDQLVGVVHAGSVTARHFTEQDVDLLQVAADRIAPLVERARLFTAEQIARAQAEEALAKAAASEAKATERAEKLQTILETIADGVAVSDLAGHIIEANRAFRELFATQRTPEFESGQTADRSSQFHAPKVASTPISSEHLPEQLNVSTALQGEVIRGPGTDIYVQTDDGRELEMTTSAAPLHDRDGHIAGAVVVAHDISWRKRLERLEREREEARASELALKETTQRMDEFLATAAHDLRSPLSVTLSAIDLAALRFERLASTTPAQNPGLAQRIDPIRQLLDEAGQSVDRLNRMVTMLFDTAQLRAGTLEIHSKPGDLAAVVREQVDALRKVDPTRTIHIEVPQDLPISVMVDADRIGQVVTNYLTNALKYSSQEQPVDVRVEIGGMLARVSVRDHGPGLPADEQKRIWQPFYRVQGIHARTGQNIGLGLGLHISKTIIERHGGLVGVESAVNMGSTFWFTLPLSTRVQMA